MADRQQFPRTHGAGPRQADDSAASSPFAALTWLGEVLILQLLFVVAALPIVTVLPAAVALQCSLDELLARRSGRPVTTFVRNLGWSLRRFWLPGLLLVLGLVVGVVAFWFWSARPTPARWLAVGALAGLGIAAGVGYLALLAAVTSRRIIVPDADRRAVVVVALDLLRSRAPQLAMAAVLTVGWLFVMMRLPTLALVGSGLVPALITWFFVGRADAHHTDDQRESRTA
jgi:hypothetical protein